MVLHLQLTPQVAKVGSVFSPEDPANLSTKRANRKPYNGGHGSAHDKALTAVVGG